MRCVDTVIADIFKGLVVKMSALGLVLRVCLYVYIIYPFRRKQLRLCVDVVLQF